jgi:hypothetical protein
MKDKFSTFFWRITAAHMVTYFIMGIIAFFLFDYEKLFSSDILQYYMKPTDSKWVVIGPALQVIRGLIFAIVLWPFRTIILKSNVGWLKLWGLLLGLSVLSTAGPSPGSIEGMIYTQIPVANQIMYLPETVLQTGLFSWIVFRWYKKPNNFLNILFVILLALIIFFSMAGYLAPQ